ncbi:unnamed protein product [Ascophyllum nodosum]
MKAAAACNKLAWLTCLGFSKAFLLPPSRGVGGTTGTFTRVLAVSSSRPRSRPSLVAGSVPSMLVEPKGRDSFKEIEEEMEGDPIKKSVGRMKPGVAKAVLTAVIPVASAVGYVAMPSSKVAVSAIGAVATGIGGGFARKKLVQARREAAPAQVARLLESKGVGNVTPQELMRELASFGLVGEEAEDVLIQIFSKYVVAMCKNSTTKTGEIKELSELRETLGLDGLLMGEALYQAASPIYSRFVAKTPSEELEDEWSPNRRALDKFIFLCDRMFEVHTHPTPLFLLLLVFLSLGNTIFFIIHLRLILLSRNCSSLVYYPYYCMMIIALYL